MESHRKVYIKIVSLFMKLMSLSLITIGFIEIMAVYAKAQNTKEQNLSADYFFVTGCSSCEETKELIDKARDRIDIKIDEYNIVEPRNQNLLEQYFSIYDVDKKNQRVPIVFVGNRYFSGKDQIRQDLIPYLESGNIPVTLVPKRLDNKELVINRFFSLKALGVAAVGIMNGLTPCSLSMLLLFISLLLMKNVNILKMGILYCVGKFITYFLMGTAFYELLQKVSLGYFTIIMKYILVCFIIIFAFLNIQDYFFARKENYGKIKLQLPKSVKNWNYRWIMKINKLENPHTLFTFSFVLGILTSVGEFLCTGQIYLTTILYMVHNQSEFNVQALTYFLIYNTGFVIPLLVITVIVYKGSLLFDVSETIRDKMPLIKLIYSILFILIGVITLV